MYVCQPPAPDPARPTADGYFGKFTSVHDTTGSCAGQQELLPPGLVPQSVAKSPAPVQEMNCGTKFLCTLLPFSPADSWWDLGMRIPSTVGSQAHSKGSLGTKCWTRPLGIHLTEATASGDLLSKKAAKTDHPLPNVAVPEGGLEVGRGLWQDAAGPTLDSGCRRWPYDGM